jgi:predicted RNA binding protein YcfA (HicA-like mRNA interferase family)
LKEYGWTFSEGANHTMAHSPDGKKKVPIPRHGSKEINPVTLKKIEKQTAVIFNSK